MAHPLRVLSDPQISTADLVPQRNALTPEDYTLAVAHQLLRMERIIDAELPPTQDDVPTLWAALQTG